MADEFDFNELAQSEEPAADPLLTRRLEAALRRLNPWLSEDNLRKAVRVVRQVQAAGLIEANEKVHIALTHGTSVEQDLGAGTLGQTVHYIDFEQPDNDES